MLRARLSWVFTLLLFSSVLCGDRSWADGKVFARAVAVPVAMPDQRAMLYFSNGLERLVIETSFVGEGTNFAWVVPLPSAPKIEAVSTNFFHSLNLSFQPKLIHRVSRAWLFYLIVGLGIVATIYTRRKSGRLMSWLVFILFLFVMPALFLPNFVRSRGLSSISSEVSVLDRRTVGIYETATVAGHDGSELLGWLNAHGFYTPTNALPVISSYATQGWVFAAMTINRDITATGRSQPHPLAFTFDSEKAVYPLRLTGLENDRCTIELFVFGPERAEATGFKVEHCGKPSGGRSVSIDDWSSQPEFFSPPDPGNYRIGASEVAALALPALVTTKLVGALHAQDMQSDAFIRWVPFESVLPVFHSSEAAWDSVLNWIMGIVVLGALIVLMVSPRLRQQTCLRFLTCVFVVAAVCGIVRWITIEKTRVHIIQGGPLAAIHQWRQLDGDIQMFALERKVDAPLTFGELTNALDKYTRFSEGVRNIFTDELLRNEPTPGNITLRNSANGVEVLWHDIYGEGHLMATFATTNK